MKRLLILLLLLPALAWGGENMEVARMNPYILGGGAASCSSTQQSDTTGTMNAIFINYDSSHYYGLGSFTANNSYTIYHVTVKLRKIGTITGNITLSLCTNNATPFPDEASATCTNADSTITHASCASGGGKKTFDFSSGYAVTNGTRYWIRMVGDWTPDGSNYTQAYYNEVGSEIIYRTDSSLVSQGYDAAAIIYHTLSSCK